MRRPGPDAIVIGIGNVLLRDEGVGVAVARRLLDDAAAGGESLPPGVHVVDGGTLGLDLLGLVESTDRLVLIDAVDVGLPPGTVSVIRDDDVHGALAGHVSPHQVGVGDLIAVARLAGVLPRQVTLVGIQPGAIEIGLDLTGDVAAAVPIAADLVRGELAAMAVSAHA
ncbi:MAG: hydrogenase maturation protease [Chloroflexota bacterium]